MNQLKKKKLNQLLQIWPKGTVVTSKWLNLQGIRFDLVNRYKRSGWVESIGQGAFMLVGDNISIYGALYSIQNQLGLSTHPAGKTALALLGKTHFISVSEEDALVLFSSKGERLPSWFINRKWGLNI